MTGAIIAAHFCLSFRDLVCVVLCAPLVVTVYRAVFCFKAVKDAVSSWGSTDAMLTVDAMHLELPHRGTGLLLHCRGARKVDPSFQLPKGSTVAIYVRNNDFWQHIERVMGPAIASVGQTLLPFGVAPKYWAPAEVSAFSTHTDDAFDFTIDLSLSTPCRTIKKQVSKLSGGKVDIQLRCFGGTSTVDANVAGDCTLLALRIFFDDFDAHTAAAQKPVRPINLTETYSSETRKGSRFCDVFWKHVELGFLLFDVVAVCFFLLLHLFPHRVYRMYSTACEGSERRAARQRQEALAALHEYLHGSRDYFRMMISKFDDAVRNRLDIVAKPDERRWDGSTTATEGLATATEVFQAILSMHLPPLAHWRVNWISGVGSWQMRAV